MSRWLLLILGLVLAALAALALLSVGPKPPAVDEIDDASRSVLESVLERAEREEASRK